MIENILGPELSFEEPDPSLELFMNDIEEMSYEEQSNALGSRIEQIMKLKRRMYEEGTDFYLGGSRQKSKSQEMGDYDFFS